MSVCEKCGNPIDDNAKFCAVCGTPINKKQNSDTITLRCKSCNGTMMSGNENDVLVCPYCGSRELIKDSDYVAVEKIKQQTEYKRWEKEEEKERRLADEQKERRYRFGAFGVVSIIFAVLCGVFSLFSFLSAKNFLGVLAGIIALLQTLLFIASVITRRGIIKTKISYLPTLLMIAGFVLIIPYFITSTASANVKEKKPDINSLISEITETTTEVPKELTLPVSSDEALKMNYEALYQMFYDAGFKQTDYRGLNDLSSSADKLNGTVTSVSADGKTAFKKGDKAMSNIQIMISYHCVKTIYPPIDQYDLQRKEYNYEDAVTQFKKEGFTNISTRTYEDNSKKENTVKEISIDGENDYIGSAPVDAKIVITYYTKKAESKAESKVESKVDSKSESKVDSSNSESSKADSGTVSPSFKETMDSYEAFFDEYVDFMKKYNDNSSDLTLLTEYYDYLEKYMDYMEKLGNIDEDSLSMADLRYYTEVNARITKKLAEIE